MLKNNTMISKILKTPILILILLISNQITYGQEKSISNDSLCVKYIFWSSPKYSVNCNSVYNRTNNNLTTFLKPDFKGLFLTDSEEYKYLKKAERKLVIGNFAFALPAGVMLGLALTGEFDRKTNTALVIGGSTLCILDISIGISSFKDLSKAVRLRNNRIKTY
jgi:hypothetical protein